MGSTSKKTKKEKAQKEEMRVSKLNQSKERILDWIPRHQQAFNALREALVTTPFLGYLDFNKEFMLEASAYLQGARGCVVPS